MGRYLSSLPCCFALEQPCVPTSSNSSPGSSDNPMLRFAIRHKPALAALCLLTLIVWASGCGYLCHERDLLEKLQLESQTRARQVAWQAVTTGHRVAMQSYFDSYIMQPAVMSILQDALSPDPAQQNQARARLFRTLSPAYDLFRQRDVRQLHFHTPDSRSFLRFHSPHNSGDSLVASRPSVVQVNRTLKPIFGFETGRVVIGFRNVFPIVWQGQHLGSVELSQPFEAVRKGLHDLDPVKEYLLALKGSVLLPKLFDEHKKLYSPALFSQEWLVEDPERELPDATASLSPAAHEIYQLLKGHAGFAAALAAGKNATIAIRRGGQVWQVGLISLHDTDGVSSAVMLCFEKSPELQELYASHQGNLLIFSLLVVFGATLLYLFLNSIKAVREQEQQMALITSNIADGIYVIDARGQITFSNVKTSELLGYSLEELHGAVAHDLFHRHITNEQRPLSECPIYQTISSLEQYKGEEQFLCKDGRLLTVEVSSQPMVKGARVIGAVSVFRDITDRKLSEQQLRLLSITDPLTGVYNRRFMQETLSNELHRADRRTEPFCLIMIDLDHFKLVNDRHGHAAGDLVLRHLVDLISARVRTSDCLARWGGEEFLLLLPNTPLQAAAGLAETLLEELRNSPVRDIGVVTASFGVTCYRTGDTADQLLQRVDGLLYAAKQAGRNLVRSDSR